MKSRIGGKNLMTDGWFYSAKNAMVKKAPQSDYTLRGLMYEEISVS